MKLKLTRVGIVDRGIFNLRLRLILKEMKLTKDILLSSIIVPLRYDIIIREDFISFYLKNKEIYINNFDLFVKKSLNELFYDYFKIRLAVYRPKLLKDRNMVVKEYKKYVKNFINLFEDIKNKGFDASFPVTLHRSIFSNKLYIGDGCHRIACLKFLGYKYLPKEHGKAVVSVFYRPRNNTRMLLDMNLISKVTYKKFTSQNEI